MNRLNRFAKNCATSRATERYGRSATGIFLILLFLAVASGSFASATINGLSGTMLVPGLDVLPPGGARAAVHMVGESKFNEASFKGVFAFADDSEVAVIKRFSIDGKQDQTDPVFAGKYKIRSNMAVAAFIDPNEDYQNSVMLLNGLPGNRVVLGLGTNIAMNENQKKASFGRYSEKGATVDPVFFVMGASLNLDPDTTLTMDYAGNDFVVGLRHRFDEALSLDFGFYTPDRVHETSRYVVGANFGF